MGDAKDERNIRANIAPDVYDWLKAYAKKTKRTVPAMVAVLIEDAKKRIEEKK